MQLLAGEIRITTLPAAATAGVALIVPTQVGAARLFARAVRTD